MMLDELPTLSAFQLDAVRETANIGAGHAATALAQLTESPIMISVPTAVFSGAEALQQQLAAVPQPVAAVVMGMLGQLSGTTALVFPRPTVVRLAEMMMRRPSGSCQVLTELETSAIREAGNILSGAYMNAMSDFLGLLLLPSPPVLVIDHAAAVVDHVVGGVAAPSRSVLCVETEFMIRNQDEAFRGFFLMLPDPSSLRVMLHVLRAMA
jgi:chemotaxis protein CheC